MYTSVYATYFRYPERPATNRESESSSGVVKAVRAHDSSAALAAEKLMYSCIYFAVFRKFRFAIARRGWYDCGGVL